MIVVIGGVKIKLQVRMKLPQAPEQDNWAEQLEGETPAGDAFEEMQARMRAEQEKFWQGEQGGQQGFMGQFADFDGNNDDISVQNCGCAFNVAKHLADLGRTSVWDSAKHPTLFGVDQSLEMHRPKHFLSCNSPAHVYLKGNLVHLFLIHLH